jgi:hypothetical protein
VRQIALLGHAGCAIPGSSPEAVQRRAVGGWRTGENAARHFDDHVLEHVIEDPPALVVEDADRLRGC